MNTDELLGSAAADGLTEDSGLLDTDLFGSTAEDGDGAALDQVDANPPETDAFWFQDLSYAFSGGSDTGNEAGDATDGGNPYQVICARPAVLPKGEPETGDAMPDFHILPIFDDWFWNPIDLIPIEDTGGSEDGISDDGNGVDDGRIGWFDDAEWTDDWSDTDWIWEDDGTEWTDEWDDTGWSDEWTEDDTVGDSGDDAVTEDETGTDTGEFMVIDWGIETGYSEPEIVICPAICIFYAPVDEPALLV